MIARQKRQTLIAVSSGEKFESKFAFVSFWKAAYPVLDNVMQAVRAKPIEMLVTISHLHMQYPSANLAISLHLLGPLSHLSCLSGLSHLHSHALNASRRLHCLVSRQGEMHRFGVGFDNDVYTRNDE